MIAGLVRFFDERIGAAPFTRKALRYVFPDHWSFMLGEIALYCFVVLVGTGIFLTFFYEPSSADVVYRGSYEPLQGQVMGQQYESVLGIVFDVPAGNLMRQTHHWAADVFVVAIVLHLLRIILTGAYRKPRELNYLVGVTLLGLAILEGFLGYSLIDDLLSGMGLAIAYAVALSLPVIGAPFALLVWGAEYPGSADFWPRLEIFHVLVIPIAIAVLISIHLAQIVRQHHTQFTGTGGDARHVHGTPMWPGYALRSISLLLGTAAVLFLLGGLVQINPVWEWGPYETYLSSNGAQPDWYLGWLIGGMRLMPPLEVSIGDYTLIPNPFFGGALFPMIVFVVLYSWPLIGRRLFGDAGGHNLLDRPRDNPRRSAFAVAFLSWVGIVFAAGSLDRLYFQSLIPYQGMIWAFRILAIVFPFVVYFLVKRICEELRRRDDRPLRGWNGELVRRTPRGGWEAVERSEPERRSRPRTDPVKGAGGEPPPGARGP